MEGESAMFRNALFLLSIFLCAAAAEAVADSARLRMSENGHFMSKAQINGRTIQVMVDTGASTVALSHEDARKAGFRPDDLDFDRPVSTANGIVKAARVRIDRIEVGGILVERVDAMVLPKGALSGSLLGMSFLSRLDSFEVKNGVLHLRN
jgi:aspartyl protease family protein